MQLRRALALALVFVAQRARADELTTRVSSEIAGYTDTVGVSVLTPSIGGSVENPTAGWSASGRYLVDMVTAASPDIVATASPRWGETRHAAGLGARYKPGLFGVAANGAFSYTPDYLSVSGGGQFTQDLDDKNLTLVQGYTFGRDTIGRNGTSFDVFSRELSTHAVLLGASRVVNPSLVVGVYGDLVFERGDQSKPYRYIPVFTPEKAPIIPRGATADTIANERLVAKPLEQLPRERNRYAVTGRMSLRTEHATLRLEERIYDDDWDLKASTTDLRWFVDLRERLMVWPHLRVHVQTGTSFWQRVYAARDTSDLPTIRTGDRELGPLSTFLLGAGTRIGLGEGESKHALALQVTADGAWTSFRDAIYVKNRFSALATTSLEVTF
jgi:hypothetical protein